MADLDRIKQTIHDYSGDEASLAQFVSVVTEELGPDWMQNIYDVVTDLTDEDTEKLNHAFQYQAATLSWNELQDYLVQEDLDIPAVQERLPILEHWLTFFGEAGSDALNQLRHKIGTETTLESAIENVPDLSDANPEIPQETDEHPPLDTATTKSDEAPKKEPIWAVERVFKQMAIVQSIQAWISARCIELGNIEIFAYPHYGFMVDLMRHTVSDIESLLASEELLPAINDFYPDGVKQLQNMQLSLERDLEIANQNLDSEETPLTRSDLNSVNVRQMLGRLDESDEPEYLGPAPDGFEPIPETVSDFDEQPIKEEYKQIENVVLSGQEQPISTDVLKNKPAEEKNTSQMNQNSVKRKLSFSLGNKKPTGN